MRWKKRRPISDLQKELEDGEWSYSHAFSLCDTAKEWGVTPSFMGICLPEDDPAVMLAYTRSVATMRAWEGHLQKIEAEKNKAKGSPGRKRRGR